METPMLERIEKLRAEAQAAIEAAEDSAGLEELRVRYLGRKAELTTILRGVKDLAPEDRGPVGKMGNLARRSLEELLETRAEQLSAAEIDRALAEDRIDVTMPGAPPAPVGHLHLITATIRRIEDIMVGLGYSVASGPEVEYDFYNFTALNHPAGHPARQLQDTFYVTAESDWRIGTSNEDPGPVLLRTHTSPVQIRAMQSQEPPIAIIVPGKVYRRDSDATHTPMFHQVEGLAVAEDLTLADLKGTLEVMLRGIFGPEREVRMRPHFFPFTEPSVEFDVSCFKCQGTGKLEEGERCNLCKGIGWIEVGGAGMVDPNVLGFVAEDGYDPERVQGFAFGMGVERIAMLKHGVPDLRRFFDNDIRVLEQFA
jgi:phenylalanyl-tRNA synthetase alpha chain